MAINIAFVVVGIVAGIIIGYKGWLIGGIIGGLGAMVLQQIKKITTLESSVKKLTQQQLTFSQQIQAIKSELAKLKSSPSTTSAVATTEIADAPVSNIKVSAQIVPAVEKTELVELELPDEIKTSQPVIPAKVEVRPKPIITKPPLPREPALGDKISAAIHRFFTEGNPIVRVGMVVMFFGVSFLVKYASSQGLFPIEFRLTGVVLGAIALLVFGWKTRARPGAYGLVLQGGGIAIIYLTLFAAAKIYGLMPLVVAFGLLFLVVMFGVLLALLQNAQVLAILATAGGFLAPILTSSGSGNHVGLFSFYLILNLGILAIALYKAWRLLNWVGFMFTFVITVAWGVLKYEPTLYASTQPFLIAFFALYLIVAILFSFKQTTNIKGMVDGSLVFGLPLAAFCLQTALLKHTEYGLAISAVVLSGVYISLAIGLSRKYLQTHRVLIESFLALGISFATLAIPLALDASWTSVTWALEATGLMWVGLRQSRMRPRVVGYLLHCAAAFSLVVVKNIHTGDIPILSGDFIGLMLLSLTAFTIAYLINYFQANINRFEHGLGKVALGFGLIWWFIAGFNELNAHLGSEYHLAAFTAYTGMSILLLLLAGKKLSWNDVTASAFILLPFEILLCAISFGFDYKNHPSQGWGVLAFTLFFVAHYYFLHGKEKVFNIVSAGKPHQLLSAWHVLSAWLLFGLIFWEVSWQKHELQLQGTAGLMIWFVAVIVPVLILIGAGQKKFWPFITFEQDYKNWIPAPLFLLAGAWLFIVCHKTLAHSEHYLPILNPLDLAQFAIILIFAYAIKREFMSAADFISNSFKVGLLGVMLFVWVNIVTVRAMSHYEDIPFDFDSLWDAVQVQMALSILWAVCALIVMNLSRRVQRRELWMIGAGLLVLVLAKLFTKDLTSSGTLARIVSFMVVGGLMLLIGFLSPIPAKRSNKDEQPIENVNAEQNTSHE